MTHDRVEEERSDMKRCKGRLLSGGSGRNPDGHTFQRLALQHT